MTRKDFEALAACIKTSLAAVYIDPAGDRFLNTTPFEALDDVASRIALYCEQNNNRFDGQLFLAACGLSGEITPKNVKRARKVAQVLAK